MSSDLPRGDDIDAALSRLPEWQPPAGFAARVAAVVLAEPRAARPALFFLLARALALAACVSVGAWLGGELLFAGLVATAAQGSTPVAWTLAAAALVLATNRIRRSLGSRA